jgi:hypothetical protein
VIFTFTFLPSHPPPPPTVMWTVTIVGPKLSGFPGNSDYRCPDYQEATVEKLFFE